MATAAASRIIIRHLTGSKANRIEQFPIDAYPELSIGRNSASTIKFDAVNDDEVSRRHATITITPGDPPMFKLIDQKSANGTWRNGKAISGDSELLPGDEIELGAGGPKFVFDMDPRPPGFVGSTRVLLPGEQGRTRVLGGAETTEAPSFSAAGPRTSAQSFGAATARRGIGQTTVMRLLSVERQSVARKAIYGVAGLIVLILVVGGALYVMHQRSVEQAEAALTAQKAEAAKTNDEVKKQLQSTQADVGMTPEKIAALYSEATVQVVCKWRLFDKASGRPIFHKMVKLANGKLVPLYVLMPDQKTIVRWLTLDDDQGVNQAIGAELGGTGFVVKSDGFILTNKHVAAPWKSNYQFNEYEQGNAIVVSAMPVLPRSGAQKKAADKLIKNTITAFEQARSMPGARQLNDWVPEGDATVFDDEYPVPGVNGGQPLVGKSELLEVQFPGKNATKFHADLVNFSVSADTAMIKIAAPQTLHAVELATDDKVVLGEHIMVLGYPGISAREYRLTSTLSASSSGVAKVEEEILNPTVTDGVISNIGGTPLRADGTSVNFSNVGYAYQLSDLATGAGNSGGPVFNSKGKVIGLFTFIVIKGSERATYAVPIGYGASLMQIQH